MACYRPVTGFQPVGGGPLSFGKEGANSRELQVPCGVCVGCRTARARSWGLRCVHEAQMHDVNSFVTLTYADPPPVSLRYSDFQLFRRRLVHKIGRPVRFFVAGEYGELNSRPHFHAILFGYRPSAAVALREGLFRSRQLEELWPHGYSSFGEVTFASAFYVAQYSLKKVVGPRAASHYLRVDPATGEYVRVVPEFCHMSLRRGIGHSWFQKYWPEVYVPRDGVVQEGGFTLPPPRYYDKLLEQLDVDLRDFKDYQRYVSSMSTAIDRSPARLAVRESVAAAKIAFKQSRSL